MLGVKSASCLVSWWLELYFVDWIEVPGVVRREEREKSRARVCMKEKEEEEEETGIQGFVDS